MNRIDEKTLAVIRACILTGKSIRQTSKIAGTNKVTTGKYFNVFPKPRELMCDYCLVREVSEHSLRNFRERRKGCKHKFCSTYCYGRFYTKKRENDECGRCGIKRKDATGNVDGVGATFCRGYCQRCYGILRAFNFDQALADAHDLRLELQEELNNGGYQKHV